MSSLEQRQEYRYHFLLLYCVSLHLESANRERSDSNSSSRNDLEDSMFRYRNVASLRSSGGGLSGHQSSSSSETSSPVSPLIGSVDVSIGTVRTGPHPMVSYPSQDDVDVDIQDQDNNVAMSSFKSRLSSPRQLSGVYCSWLFVFSLYFSPSFVLYVSSSFPLCFLLFVFLRFGWKV